MTDRDHLLGRVVLLLVTLVGLEVVAIGGAVITSYQSAGGQGPVTYVVDGVQAGAKVAIAVVGIVGKALSALIPEAQGEDVHGMGVFLPAAASTGGAHIGFARVGEDCCGPDSPLLWEAIELDLGRCCGEKQGSFDRGEMDLAL